MDMWKPFRLATGADPRSLDGDRRHVSGYVDRGKQIGVAPEATFCCTCQRYGWMAL
jgi:hypothetical protein